MEAYKVGSDIFASIGTVFKLAEFALKYHDAPIENRVFVDLIKRVQVDLDEAIRVRHNPAVLAHISSLPTKKQWIDNAIISTQRSLNEIGLFVESMRIDQEADERASAYHRLAWIFSNHQNVLTRQAQLSTCHQSLAAALHIMHIVELQHNPTVALDQPPPRYTPPYEDSKGLLRSPMARRRKSESNLRRNHPSPPLSPFDALLTAPPPADVDMAFRGTCLGEKSKPWEPELDEPEPRIYGETQDAELFSITFTAVDDDFLTTGLLAEGRKQDTTKLDVNETDDDGADEKSDEFDSQTPFSDMEKTSQDRLPITEDLHASRSTSPLPATPSARTHDPDHILVDKSGVADGSQASLRPSAACRTSGGQGGMRKAKKRLQEFYRHRTPGNSP